ncbi:MAG: type II toxin-antitoxin system VapC family toxin [Planctomycetia bacterium]|jgi:predicted nucleic acid-binding protein|nr:type II toxin-antitoxin system VapC family toxin [Planctomycetia bacterium]
MTVFADTFALIAWLNPRDESHDRVCRYLEVFTGRLVTTEWVLMELADALCAPRSRSIAVSFLKAVRTDAFFEIVGYESGLYQAGFSLFESRLDKGWSLTDCISFAVMNERGIIESLTADRDFEQAGFRAVFKKA